MLSVAGEKKFLYNARIDGLVPLMGCQDNDAGMTAYRKRFLVDPPFRCNYDPSFSPRMVYYRSIRGIN